MLQWSHAQPNVETIEKLPRGSLVGCFNGATLSRTWKLGVAQVTLRHCNIASMEPRSAERGNKKIWNWHATYQSASMEPRSAERGNWFALAGSGCRSIASMEPRSAERGNLKAMLLMCISIQRFNGATLSRTWKRPRPASGCRCRRRFNGATLSRTWKQRAGCDDCGPRRTTLQWSHAQPNVETCQLSPNGADARAASMEPRSAERGNSGGIQLVATYTKELQWSHAQPNVETAFAVGARTQRGQLQWSHAQPNVETMASSR